MNLIADENLDYPIVLALRAEGHNVYSILENFAGTDDETVLGFAAKQKSVLITSDKDFGELVYRLKRINAGIILLRLAGMDINQKIHIVISAVKEHESKLSGAFSVISNNNIRIRKLT